MLYGVTEFPYPIFIFYYIFLFAVQLGCFLLHQSSRSLILYWFFSSVIFISVIEFLISGSIYILKVSLRSSAYLWPLLWVYQACCLSVFHLALLLCFYPVLSFGTYSSVSLSLLEKSATSPDLEVVAFEEKVLWCNVLRSPESGASWMSPMWDTWTLL